MLVVRLRRSYDATSISNQLELLPGFGGEFVEARGFLRRPVVHTIRLRSSYGATSRLNQLKRFPSALLKLAEMWGV
jgi:hypothetical protein